MTDLMRASATRFRANLTLGASIGALGAAMLMTAAPAYAQASATVPDPANSTSSAGNQNESGSAEARKAAACRFVTKRSLSTQPKAPSGMPRTQGVSTVS